MMANSSVARPRKRWIRAGLACLSCLCLPGLTPSVQAAEITEIVDNYPAADGLGTLTPSLSLDWAWRVRRGSIQREYLCLQQETIGGTSACPNGSRVADAEALETERLTTTLTLRGGLGVGRLFSVNLSLPILLHDKVKLGHTKGVTPSNSPVDPANRPSLFTVGNQGPTRTGIGDPTVSLRVAPFSSARDPQSFSWVLGFATTIPLASIRSATNEAPGEGIWGFELESAFSARVTRWLEPFLALSTTLRFGSDESPFQDFGDTQGLVGPAHMLSLKFGAEFIPFLRPSVRSSVRLELGGRIDFVFAGRAYTDLFDALGSSGCDPDDVNAPCDLTTYTRGEADPGTGRPRRTDGVTDEEAHAVLTGWLGLRYEVLDSLEFSARATVSRETDHFLTYAEPGRDLDGQRNIQRSNSDGDNEYSPTYNAAYDNPGNRFRSADTLTVGIDLHVRGKF